MGGRGLERLVRRFVVGKQGLGVQLHAQARVAYGLDDGQRIERRVDEVGLVGTQGLEAKACPVAFDTPAQIGHEGLGLDQGRRLGHVAPAPPTAPNECPPAEVAADGRQMD